MTDSSPTHYSFICIMTVVIRISSCLVLMDTQQEKKKKKLDGDLNTLILKQVSSQGSKEKTHKVSLLPQLSP